MLFRSAMISEPYLGSVRFVVTDPSGAVVPYVPVRMTLPATGVNAAFGDGVAQVRGIYSVQDAFIVADSAGEAISPTLKAGATAGDYFLTAHVGQSGPVTAQAGLEIRPPAPIVLDAAVAGVTPSDPQTVRGTAYAGSLVRIYRVGSGALVGSQQLGPGQTEFSIRLPNPADNDRSERWIVTATFDASLANQLDQSGGNESNLRPVANTPDRELYLNSPAILSSGMIVAGGTIGVSRNGSFLAGLNTPYRNIRTDFELNSAGWVASPSGTVTHVAADQVDDGYLSMLPDRQGGIRYFSAPAEYLGSKAAFLGGSLSFMLKAGSPVSASVNFVLEGAGLVITRSAGSGPGLSWKDYRIPLFADGGWKIGSLSGQAATQAEFLAVMGSLDRLLVQGTDDTGAVLFGLDKVAMEGPETTTYGLSLDLVRNSKNQFVVTETNRFGNISGTTILPLVTEDSVAPRAPAILALVGDSNVSGDQVLNRNRLVLIAKADPNAHPLQIASMNQAIRIFRDGVQIGSTIAAADGSWSFADPDVLGDGVYSYTATATDRAGNESVRSLVFKSLVDTVAPVAPTTFALTPDTGVVGDSVTFSPAPRLSGQAEPGSLVEVFEKDLFLGSATADNRGRWGLDLPSLADGAHALRIQSTDLAGNTSDLSTHVVVDRKSTRLNSSHIPLSRMPSSA
mgnify:FL=1